MSNMASFKHNKKRNTGLVYEFLVRRMAQQVLENDVPGYQRSVEIVKKYYSEGQPLAAERELFEVIKSTRGVTESAARKILGEVQRHVKLLDQKKVEIKKSNLIKEINYAFGKDFFLAHRVPEYRFLASVHMLLESSRNPGAITESVEKIQIEEALVKYMTTKAPQAQTKSSDRVDGLVCALAAKKFQEKYGATLNKDQKVLIEKFMRAEMSGDKAPLARHLQEEKQRILKVLEVKQHDKMFRDDKIMQDRLFESVTRLASNTMEKTDESTLEEMMLYHKLVEELESDE